MGDPLVCAILLTRDRPLLAPGAVDCFRDQVYTRKDLLVYDTGTEPTRFWRTSREQRPGIVSYGVYRPEEAGITIGELRNRAIGHAIAFLLKTPDIFVHWDDDDYSHPNRIAEQVQLLQSSGADVVGYREMLFWRERQESRSGEIGPAQAWLYSSDVYPVGTSLCYWRRTWEQRPFDATSHGEDWRFCMGRNVVSVRSIGPYKVHMGNDQDGEPRMVARIHGGNTSKGYTSAKMKSPEWRRVPEWDNYCKGVFEK